MKINGYEISIRRIGNATHKFNVGDIIKTSKSCCGHDNEVGIVLETRDEKRNRYLTTAGRGWYYYVEYDGGSCTEREEDLTLLMSKGELFNRIKGL